MKFNESLRDKMVGKPEEEILSGFMKLTPHAALWILDSDDVTLDIETYNKYRKIAEERIENIEEELNEMFELQDGQRQVKTLKLFEDVIKWVEKYGGNKENLIQYGIKDFANQIQSSFDGLDSHMWEQLYSYDSVHLFHKLLKQLAIDEVSYNNKEVGQFIWG